MIRRLGLADETANLHICDQTSVTLPGPQARFQAPNGESYGNGQTVTMRNENPNTPTPTIEIPRSDNTIRIIDFVGARCKYVSIQNTDIQTFYSRGLAMGIP